MKLKFADEFRAFIMRGNVVDMAVGIIIGAAFGKIVTSFVADIMMPPIGWLIGGVDFTNLKIVINDATTINYGNFIQTLFDFIITAFAVFLVIKAMNKIHEIKKKVETEAEVEKIVKKTISKEEELLTEIRDLLKNK